MPKARKLILILINTLKITSNNTPPWRTPLPTLNLTDYPWNELEQLVYLPFTACMDGARRHADIRWQPVELRSHKHRTFSVADM